MDRNKVTMRAGVLLRWVSAAALVVLMLEGCASSSTGVRGEGSPASNAPGNTRDIAPGIKSNVNRTGTGGG